MSQLVLSAELWEDADTYTLRVTDPETDDTEEVPIPRRYAEQIPQMLQMLR